jgi:hypothetical protein
MSRRTKLIIAGVVVVLGIGGLIAAIATAQSPGGYIKSHYRHVGSDDGAQVYASTKSASATATDIANAVKPADRLTTTSGVFLRYSNDYVAVLTQPAGGSRIEVSSGQTGYTHFYGYVGGFWGTYSGPAGAFRGGGPGAGK